jgi:hypothetical protein
VPVIWRRILPAKDARQGLGAGVANATCWTGSSTLSERVRAGLVLVGEPGAAKTALLDYLAGRASGCRVVRTAGIQSEMELAFAELQQVCALISFADYASSVLDNALGHYGAARDAAWRAFESDQLGYGPLVVPELAEAASRTGDVALMTAALEWLSEPTRVTPTDWALGIEPSSVPCSARARPPTDCAGSRSRRWAGPASARRSPALTCSTASGYAASAAASTPASSCASRTPCWTRWASRRSPTGPAASWRPSARPPQAGRRDHPRAGRPGGQVARLARDGLSNPEIGARLFINAHGPVPPGQGLRQARHQLPQPASPRPSSAP